MKDLGTSSSTLTATSNGEQAPSKFTPGPWFVSNESIRQFDGWNGVRITSNCDADGEDIPGVSKNGGINIGKLIGPDAVANARLIAAAPDLLDALFHAVEAIEYGCPEFEAVGEGGKLTLDVIQAAINKALGRNSDDRVQAGNEGGGA